MGGEAARLAIGMLHAVDAPAGPMEVVLGAGESGILLHEAVGHGLEADFARKRTSNYADRIGQPVASALCTVIDDGTVDNARGTINVDDEGNPGRRNVLIENGVADSATCRIACRRSTSRLRPRGTVAARASATSRCRA